MLPARYDDDDDIVNSNKIPFWMFLGGIVNISFCSS